MLALSGIRVVDASASIAGAWCSRLLADFGADVAVVEPPDGHKSRSLEPLDEDGRGILASYILANKRSLALDLEQAVAQEALKALISRADVFLHPGTIWLENRGLSPQSVEAASPTLISLSMTPFGEGNRRSERDSNDLALYATSGWASLNGLSDREPLKGSSYTASFTAGSTAYGAVLAALFQREVTGEGQLVEVAEVEGLMSMFGRALLLAQYEGKRPTRVSEPGLRSVYPVPTSDGHISLVLGSGERFRDAMVALGLYDLAEDESLQDPRVRAERIAEWEPHVLRAIAAGRKRDLFEHISEHRVATGIVLTMADVTEDVHLADRGYWVKLEGAGNGEWFPGAPAKLSVTPWSLRCGMPDVGAHTGEVLRDWCDFDDMAISQLEHVATAGLSE